MLRPDAAAPDHARSRLRTLGVAPPPRDPGPSWGGPEEVDVGPAPAAPDGRVGWPTAAPGTPAARLRLEPPPPATTWDDDEPAPRSAWDPPPRGERPGGWAARWWPASWIGARWDPGRTGALALAAVAAVAAVVAALGVWVDRPRPEPMPALPIVAPVDPAAPGAAAPTDGPLVVSVAGRVRRPGLVRLPPGSRVGDAVDAAGGAEPDTDLTSLNLAARLSDGEQVLVGVAAPAGPSAPPAAASAGTGAGAASGRLDLNTATLEQLDQLPGVGPVTAQRILEWRAQNGRFAAVEQLQEVSGIGDARLATLRDLVTV